MSIRILAVVLVSAFSSACLAALPTVQLVQSVPLETHLEHPKLPHTADIWLEMVKSAKTSIDLGQFYVQNQNTSLLEPIMKELEKAGARGVKIRFLVDTKMKNTDPASLERIKKIPNTELAIYDLSKITGGIIHAKYFVVDQRFVFVGSANFDWRALDQIHETGLWLDDETVARQSMQIFEIDWQIAKTGKPPKAVTSGAPLTARPTVELVSSPPKLNPAGIRDGLSALLELIAEAKKTLRFQVMTYSPTGNKGYWGDIDQALIAATKRGVQVEMMVADWSIGKYEIGYLKALAKNPGIHLKIVSFPEHSQGCIDFARVTHSKMMVVDSQKLWVGTSNWSEGYFTASRDLEVIVRDQSMAKQGEEILKKLWDSSFAATIVQNQNYQPKAKECNRK